ncbi:Iron-sulfur assembly protein 1 [Tilletia horrida]|uniref:Iron-sulfur assembly protein 1 n=1 Tax=Tilletia horrida TaxID=155126 RepID=A0AAN6GV81_9BASI|nr:Iron-sulfur assembly protein 1 [Tilletia horrida]KAK0568365.1 Iron-sulfur assembly protein 1 [Tilletia horrida]
MPRANLDEPPSPSPAQPPPASDPKSPATGKPVEKPRASKFRAQKAPITLTAPAVERLRALQTSPTDPRLIRISVRNKGCAGMSYHLEYVKPEEAGKFDERIQQDDVTVLIDSKALFSIIGSEMDWKEDRLSAKFVFNNPLAVSCGCGESFAVK